MTITQRLEIHIQQKRSQIVWNVETQDVPEIPVETLRNVKCNLSRSDGLSIRLSTCTFPNSLNLDGNE